MKTRNIFLYAILFLFFFQLLTDFVGGIYAFGLLGTSIPPELAAVALLFAPVLLLVIPRAGRKVLTGLVIVILLARVVEPALDTRWRMLVSGLGAAAWLMWFPVALWRGRWRHDETVTMMWGLLLGALLSVLLRTLGSGVDISVMGLGQVAGVLLAGLAAWLWWGEGLGSGVGSGVGMGLVGGGEEGGERATFERATLLALGVMAVLTLIYFAFAAPYVMARWTGLNLTLTLGLLLLAWAAFVAAISWSPRLLNISKSWLLIWNIIFVFALFLTIKGQQTIFPASPDAYPLMADYPAIWANAVFYLMLLLSPIVFLDFHHLTASMIGRRPTLRQMGGGFTLVALFLLLAIFGHVFTTVYDYIPVVGPFFRNAFAWVYLFVGVAMLAGVLAIGKNTDANAPSIPKAVTGTGLLLTAVILAAHLLVAVHLTPAPPADALTILTYNIQQGYSEAGRKNYGGQLARIRAIHPDIIGLQESDAARIANSNDDIVRYFADHLNMYSYYGPKTVTGTFGVALLSRYPIKNPITLFLYSEGEQVAVIRAQVMVGAQPLTVFVTHLGNGGPMIQQQQLLQIIDETPRAVVLGDFNFRSDTPQYALTTRRLLGSWTQKWPDWQDDQGQKPDTKIDHIFITSDLRVIDARYFPAGPSDHPALTAVIAP